MYLCALVTYYKSEQASDGIVFSHRYQSFIIILSLVLRESLGTETGFIVAILLDLKYPACLDNFDIGGLRHQGPDIIAHNTIWCMWTGSHSKINHGPNQRNLLNYNHECMNCLDIIYINTLDC